VSLLIYQTVGREKFKINISPIYIDYQLIRSKRVDFNDRLTPFYLTNTQNRPIFAAMKRILPLLILIILVVINIPVFSQCAMCAGQVETAHGAGSSVAEGVNKGVLYIFMMPYLVMATIGYFWWRSRKKVQQQ
jgi:uncharacterized membrane protein